MGVRSYLPFRAEGHFFLGTTPKWAYEGQFTTIILHSIQDYYVNGYDTLQSTPSLHINLHCKKYSPKLSLQRVGEGLDAAEYCQISLPDALSRLSYAATDAVGVHSVVERLLAGSLRCGLFPRHISLSEISSLPGVMCLALVMCQ